MSIVRYQSHYVILNVSIVGISCWHVIGVCLLVVVSLSLVGPLRTDIPPIRYRVVWTGLPLWVLPLCNSAQHACMYIILRSYLIADNSYIYTYIYICKYHMRVKEKALHTSAVLVAARHLTRLL